MSNQQPAEVSDLTSRRMQQLVDENRQLRFYVADVMDRLHENERLFSRFFKLEKAVLAASDPEDLCFTLLRKLRTHFELDMVRFWFSHTDIVGSCQMESVSERDLVWLEESEINNMGLIELPVTLLSLSKDQGFSWLDKRDESLQSLALLRLGTPATPFGILGLGSIDAERFHPGQSSDFLQHLAQVVSLSLEHAISRERLARFAMTDSLTGSHNRRFLQPYSHQPLSQWFGHERSVVCLYIDVDHFKNINDQCGHSVGDEILTQICVQIRHHIRDQDPLIRMGGDEFALLLAGCTAEKAEKIAGHITKSCAKLSNEERSISVSIGLARSGKETDMQVTTLIEHADHAMYVAKALGGNRVEISDEHFE
ncbi:MAG: DUF484 family protein [Mariprofundaceae bacterium]